MANKKKNEITIRSSAAEYLTFIASNGNDDENIEMRYEDENIWLTQKMMAVLYDVDVRTINEHIKKVFSDNELEEISTIRNFRIVQKEGNRQINRDLKHYNLQMIRARRRIPMTMEDWSKRLDIFLEADEHEVLKDLGKVTAEIAKEHAETEFEKYRIVQDRLFESDFDRFLLELEEEVK